MLSLKLHKLEFIFFVLKNASHNPDFENAKK